MSSVIERVEEILKAEYSTINFIELMQEIFDSMTLVAPNNFCEERSNFSSHIVGRIHVGNYTTPEGKKIAIFAVQLKKETYVEGSRSTQRSYAKKLIEGGNCDAAIVAFYTEGEQKWRLSFVRLDYEMKIEKGKLKTTENITPAKRYSFLVGKDEPCHTAVDRFRQFIIDQNANPSLDELEEAFSVEKVTKEFFNLYCEKFYQLQEYLDSNEDFIAESQKCGFTSEQYAKKLMGQIVFLYFLQKKGWLGVNVWAPTLTEKEYKNVFFVSGAHGRIIREHLPKIYIQQSDGSYRLNSKALDTLPTEDEEVIANNMPRKKTWGDGSKKFLRTIFDYSKTHKGHFFENYLEPLFYNTLNKNRGEMGYCPILHCRIPFLSGGLFDPLIGYDWKANYFDIPDEIFSNKKDENDRNGTGILDIFDRYNFTMSEDEPMEREVAIDPEMLGKIFENLLEVKDRKSKGAFYTPREIVHYMCQESLINYLVRKTDISEDAIRDFILYGDFMKDEDTVKSKREGNGGMYISEEIFKINEVGNVVVDRLTDIDNALASVRVADPAVGSGAFPLGMLNEIVRARQNISAYMAISKNSYEARLMYKLERSPHALKYETIRNCIYAVDIEPSAVDITQLRLWLALVIDDEITPNAANEFEGHKDPLPLPNLDCNILCGNSLIDEFKGIKLVKESDILGTMTGGVQLDIGHIKFEPIIKQLLQAQDALFACDEPYKKFELKIKIQSLKDLIVKEQLSGCDEDTKLEYQLAIRRSSKPFILWQLDFARVFRDSGGFDIVIGNPPYRLCQPSNTSKYLLDYYKDKYRVASYKIDLFHLFFELGIDLLKPSGILSYITPNTYLTNKYIKPLRKYILDNCLVQKIINHDKVFDAASVDTATIIMSKEKAEDHQVIVMQSANFVFEDICVKHQKDWNDDSDLVFNINKEESISMGNSVPLGEICKTYFGIQAYDRKSSISPIKVNEDYLPFIDGADIHPYTYAIPKIYFNYLPDKIKSGGDWSVYSRERIVVRQIGQIPVVGLCEKEILGSNTLYSIYPKDDSYELKFLLACLNSSFIKNYWKAKYSDNKALFPKIKGFQLKELPIPKVTREEQKKISEIVETILDIKKEDISADIDGLEKNIDELIFKLYQRQ